MRARRVLPCGGVYAPFTCNAWVLLPCFAHVWFVVCFLPHLDLAYWGAKAQCTYNTKTTPPAAKVSSYVKLPHNNYTAMMNALALVGPLGISVYARVASRGGAVPPLLSSRVTCLDVGLCQQGCGCVARLRLWRVHRLWH